MEQTPMPQPTIPTPVTVMPKTHATRWWLLAVVLVVAIGAYAATAYFTHIWPFMPPAAPAPVTYTNAQYGLSVSLPNSWTGFTTFDDGYSITTVATGAQEGTGVVIKIRHPLWTAANPREDLPIMVFTPVNWQRVLAEQISVGAAPIPPSFLARNSQYIFALPARYNFDYKTGWEEVDQIVHSGAITALEPTLAK